MWTLIKWLYTQLKYFVFFCHSDWYSDKRCHRQVSPMCHHSAGLPVAYSFQSHFCKVCLLRKTLHLSLYIIILTRKIPVQQWFLFPVQQWHFVVTFVYYTVFHFMIVSCLICWSCKPNLVCLQPWWWWQEETCNHPQSNPRLSGTHDRHPDWKLWRKMVQLRKRLSNTIKFNLTPYVLKTNSPALVSHRPLWLSPHQVMVVPVGPTCDEYAQRVSSVWNLWCNNICYLWFQRKLPGHN